MPLRRWVCFAAVQGCWYAMLFHHDWAHDNRHWLAGSLLAIATWNWVGNLRPRNNVA